MAEADVDSDSSDSDSDFDDEEDALDTTTTTTTTPLRRIASPPAQISISEVELESSDDEEDSDYEDDDEEDFADLALVRTHSRHLTPPELSHDHSSDEDSEDDSMPPSPPQPSFQLSQKQRNAIATTSFYDEVEPDKSSHPIDSPSSPSVSKDTPSFFNEGYYLPGRDTVTPIISAY